MIRRYQRFLSNKNNRKLYKKLYMYRNSKTKENWELNKKKI